MKKTTVYLMVLMLGMLLTIIGCQSTQPSNRQLLQESYLQTRNCSTTISN